MSAPKLSMSYTQLPAHLYAQSEIAPAPIPELLWTNDVLAAGIGVSSTWLSGKSALDLFSGHSDQDPIIQAVAMAYSGHQFGHLSPQLGDGRAILIGEYQALDNTLYDVHLKGSGRTPYSRGGDGKSTLRAALKEVLFSECLAALDIPTTRSLAVLSTGETVMRQEPHHGAVLVRMAKSLIRVGTFQFAALTPNPNAQDAPTSSAVQSLADFLITREYPQISLTDPHRIRALLSAAISRQATLIAKWMSTGFIHGVMNTDNMALSGETIDFGPCAFMERFRPDQVYSSIDRRGRYAWHKQAEIAVWNLTRFAETLIPFLDEDPQAAIAFAEAELDTFAPQFAKHFSTTMIRKIGLSANKLSETDISETANQLFAMLTAAQPDFTLFFRALAGVLRGNSHASILALCRDPKPCVDWLKAWELQIENTAQPRKDIATEMDTVNPAYIPRLHLVEDALVLAGAGDMSAFERLLAALRAPYVTNSDYSDFDILPTPDQETTRTFCET